MTRSLVSRSFVLCVTFLALAPARLATAQAPKPTAPAAAAAADDKAILPYLDEGTFVVIRFDIDRVDQEAFVKWAEQAMESMFKAAPIPPDIKPQIQAQAMASIGGARQWMTDMKEAGAGRVYLLFDTADVTAGSDDPVIVVPTNDQADLERLRGLLQVGPGTTPAELGQALVCAKTPQLERLKARFEPGAVPVDRPDLAHAFAASGGGAPLRIALLPGDKAREWVEQSLPKLPEQLGGGDTKLLSRGVKWASVVVTQKPETHARLTIRAENADQAKALLETLNKGMDWLKEQLENVPQGGEIVEAMDAIKPKLAGETITATVDPVLLQMALMGTRMRAEAEVVEDDGAEKKPATPKKADDGGL